MGLFFSPGCPVLPPKGQLLVLTGQWGAVGIQQVDTRDATQCTGYTSPPTAEEWCSPECIEEAQLRIVKMATLMAFEQDMKK